MIEALQPDTWTALIEIVCYAFGTYTQEGKIATVQEKIELIIILDGEAKYFINNNLIILKKGDFLFVDVNNMVEAKFEKKCELLAIHSPSIPTDKIRLD